MTDTFKQPAFTSYAPRQNFAFIHPYIKGGFSTIRPVNVSDIPVNGDSGILDIQKTEKTVKGGFSEGTTLKQAPIFPEPSAAPSKPARSARKNPPKAAKRNFPRNDSNYHYNNDR